jgi:hypothetical protein
MQEEVDLSAHPAHLCSCLNVVDALADRGQLTQTELQRARRYLAIQEKPWPYSTAIADGAILYLDALSVTYLQHVGVLSKIRGAGLTAVIPEGEIAEANYFAEHGSLVSRSADIIETIRRAVQKGIVSGKIVLAPVSKTEVDEAAAAIRRHPSLFVMEAVASAEILIADDRFFNQYRSVDGQAGVRPIWTTFDLLNLEWFSPSERSEHRTTLRRAGLCFAPLGEEEIRELVEQALIAEGRLVETGELKAVRENLLISIMSDALQLPKETPWLANTTNVLTIALRSQWREDVDESVARARSDWLMSQIDIRKWSQRQRIAGHPEVANRRYAAQIFALIMMSSAIEPRSREKYWRWLEGSLLDPIKDEQRNVLDEALKQVRTFLLQAADEMERRHAN